MKKIATVLFNKFSKLLYVLLTYVAVSQAAYADFEWPQEISSDEGNIVVYQPQPEKLEGNILTARSAMAIEINDKEPIYGVFWFTTTIETDRSENTVNYTNIKVLKVGWPDSKASGEKKFTDFVEEKLKESTFTSELSKLTASLATADVVKKSLENIKNDPPVIIFKDKLSVLLNYDGKPIFKDIENTHYQRAMNTPFAVIKVNSSKFFLTSGDFWYQASSALGPWIVTEYPPADLVKMMPKEEGEDENQAKGTAPAIVVATKSTELVVTSGKAEWKSIVGGKLLYVENTETPWLREIESGDMYLLLSGRWFKSKNQQGPWTFVRPDKLPKAFSDIPPESEIGGLRTSVAGTEEAEQAVIDSQIPQTAAIKRSEAALTVEYHGKPEFKNISGTDVAYAVNTAAQVLQIKGVYYAVDNGVWFKAKTAKGPWEVADSIPDDEIALIPASSPVYNTTYVKVYDSTPEVVYVGYTPGYMWSYPYYGVPIYGTGWYYPPYMGGWYYPRPPTWGMHVGYSPWGGWSYGVSWGGPFFRVGVSWGGGYGGYYRPCCGGWYGGGYRGGYHRTNININGNINIGNTINAGNRTRIGNQIHNSNIKNKIGNNGKVGNIYNRPSNRARNANSSLGNKGLGNKGLGNKGISKPNRANNVFSDKNGGVVRKNGNTWQSRTDKSWKNVPQSTRNDISNRTKDFKSNRPTQSINRQGSFDHKSMNRQYRARQSGGFNRQMPMRGGGGRRR